MRGPAATTVGYLSATVGTYGTATGSPSSDPPPGGGLIVADLAGQASTTLPETYLAQHATYGWACTIDGAQGATADLGILLARPAWTANTSTSG